MKDEYLARERDLKGRVNAALDQEDWAEAHRAALALAELYDRLEDESHVDLASRARWKALKEQWRDFVRRMAARLPKTTDENAEDAPTHSSTPSAPAANPIRAAIALGLDSAVSDSRRERECPSTRPTAERGKGKTREPEDDERPSWLLRERPSVTFDDIIGLDDLKQRIRRFVVKFKHPEEVAKWKGAKLGDRMILYGPPGTGKTMFARAVAHEIDADFYLVKGSNLLDKWVGESQKNVSRLFEEVRASRRAVVFLDEIDGILSSRGSSSTVRDGVVSEFLQEMEGISSPNTSVLFIGATNLPSELDDAVISRFGAMFYVPLPDYQSRLVLLQRGFAGFPYGAEADVSLEKLAERMEGYSMRTIQGLLYELADIGILNSAEGRPHRITNADIESVLRNLSPPMSPRELAKYERFRV